MELEVLEESVEDVSHKSRPKLICDKCEFQTVYPSNLQRHIKHVHCNQKPNLLCPICGKTFSSSYNLGSHSLQHDSYTAEPKYTCKICNKKYMHKSQFKGHMNGHSGLRETCICGAKFVYPSDLKRHQRVCGSSARRVPTKYQCKICLHLFTKPQPLKDHIAGKHEGIEKYKCSCGKAFRWRSSLKKHTDKCPFAKKDSLSA